MTNRRINDFDNFINANPNKMLSPRNIPLAVNNFNTLPNPAYQKHHRHLSPNKFNNTTKPMLSPARSPRNLLGRLKGKNQNETARDNYCANQNHPPRKADFAIKIEGIDTFYCQNCAGHAMRQGFKVRRINNSIKQRCLPHYPQYAKNEKYLQITQFMNSVLQLQNEYKKIQSKRIREHYKQQADALNQFYDSLHSIIDKMRSDHLADLMEQCEQNAARESMSLQNLKIHFDELNQSWADIQNNITTIVQSVTEKDFNACMVRYNNDLRVFTHKLEEFEDQKQKYTTYSQNDLAKKIDSFQTILMEIWEENQNQNNRTSQTKPNKTIVPQPKRSALQPNYKSNPNRTLRNVHEMIPKPKTQQKEEIQGPFRNLFTEQEERLPQASPQFKAF